MPPIPGMRAECRKFTPNIFNKSKCSNCFRQKEEHSAEALDVNRATRKVSKCGYLFVAPGWDFSNPLNRTKRWQRRWFVLYDDGELSYSLDEHPETIPQASIDMNKVLEVTEADEMTGNAYSLAITAPDTVHFVKGTCREEARWWRDVLSIFPRSKGRHRRNATFPGSQTSTILQSAPLNCRASTEISRPRFNSCHDTNSIISRHADQQWLSVDEEPVFSNKELAGTQAPFTTTPASPASSSSPPTRDKMNADEKTRIRRVSRVVRTGLAEQLTKERSRREEQLKDIAETLTRPRVRRSLGSKEGIIPTREGEDVGDGCNDKNIRGDPDGCVLDSPNLRYSPSAELRVSLPAEDLLNIKKGWLMKQNGSDWSKHWFVLRGTALMYYRDPQAEDKGILDGVLDLSAVRAVSEVACGRNYGFQTVCWDDRRFVLSAVTSGIRANWILAIKKATGLTGSNELLNNTETTHSSSTPLITSSQSGTSIYRSSNGSHRSFTPPLETPPQQRSSDLRWGHPAAPLPPSPPLTRTPISRVKERAKTQLTRSRVYNKRARSSPPAARRNTVTGVEMGVLKVAESGSGGGGLRRASSGENCSEDWQVMYDHLSKTDKMPPLTRGRSVDSLSDLTNIDLDLDLTLLDKDRICEEYDELKSRFEKAIQEIRAMKRELRESHSAHDELELKMINLRQDSKRREDSDRAQNDLMAVRVMDLTGKLIEAEKQLRTLKIKIAKVEGKEKRRSLSLKGRESFELPKEVDEKLRLLETKMAALETSKYAASVTKSLRRKSLDSPAAVEPIKVLLRLTSLEGRLASMDSKKPDERVIEKTVNKLEKLLRDKLTELLDRRRNMIENGLLDAEGKMRLLAERLAYEAVIVRKLQDVVGNFGSDPFCFQIQELSAMISRTQKKVAGENLILNGNGIEALTAVLTQSLVQSVNLATGSKNFDVNCLPSDVSFTELLDNHKKLVAEVEEYKRRMIKELANGLAVETMCLSAEYEETRVDDLRIKNAWLAAQETLNKELVQADISHVAMRCAARLSENASLTKLCLSEELSQEVELQKVMDDTLNVLTEEYEKSLIILKKENALFKGDLEDKAAKTRQLLAEFVSVLGECSLIENRIREIGEKSKGSPNRKPIVRGVSLKNLMDPTMEAEFVILFHKLKEEATHSADAIIISEIVQNLKECVHATNDIQRKLGQSECNIPQLKSWTDISEVCHYLTQSISDLKELTNNCPRNLELQQALNRTESRLQQELLKEQVCLNCPVLKEALNKCQEELLTANSCTRCAELQDALNGMETRYAEEITKLQLQHQKELNDTRIELEAQRESLVCEHLAQQAALEHKTRILERRLGTLDAEYSQQIENLREAYHNTLSAESNDSSLTSDSESIRQRYQTEIQQLRTLCEKGLAAIDTSHRRIVAGLEEKHRQQLAAMAAEKEQALAEETQATLAALDAMRKAHEAEVQREVAKFKQEFIRQIQASRDISALQQAHEAEMEEIRQEILSLSQKYSEKCVESAALEEQLSTVNRQLANAQQHILQLDARNKQLRAHLLADTTSLTGTNDLSLTLTSSTPVLSNTRNMSSTEERTHGSVIEAAHSSRDPQKYQLHLPLCSVQRQRFMANNNNSSSCRVTSIVTESSSSSCKLSSHSTTESINMPKKFQSCATSLKLSPSLHGVRGLVAEKRQMFEQNYC